MDTITPVQTAHLSLGGVSETSSLEKFLSNLLRGNGKIDAAYLLVSGNGATSDEIDLIILSRHGIDDFVHLIDTAADDRIFFSLTVLDTDDEEAGNIVSGYRELPLA